MFKNCYTLALLVIFSGAFQSAEAKVVLPAVFSDHMVLQQKTNAAIWGKALPGVKVSISTGWNKKKYTGIADTDGNWKISVLTPSYGGPYDIEISDGELMVLKDVLIGDVWICSGQSNMEMPLAGWGKIDNYEQEIAKADVPGIRLLQVKQMTANQPDAAISVANGGWVACKPATIAEFSATAYFFAREVNRKTKIPIGLIHTSWGGTIAEAWMSASVLKTMPDFKTAVLAVEDAAPAAAQQKNPNRPSVLYNAMIYPFIQFSIRGAIWYQGESNADRAYQYRELFPALIKNWREKWATGDFPFYFVQLANFKKKDEKPAASAWAELREAQLKTLSLPHTGMATTIDIGLENDIHPKNKQEVGRRLALIALAQTYHQPVSYSGPLLQRQKIEKDRIRLNFKFADSGLQAKDGQSLKGFAIAGADQQFYWADAVIKGKEIIVSCKQVISPVAVRYDWGNNPEGNLYNGAGLPASPFRTDDWQGITYGKK